MGAMASQITHRTIVYSTVYSGADQRKYQSSASLAFVQGIHRPATRRMFPFDYVIMTCITNTVQPQIDAYGSCFVVFWRGWFAPVQFYPHLSGLHHKHSPRDIFYFLCIHFLKYVYERWTLQLNIHSMVVCYKVKYVYNKNTHWCHIIQPHHDEIEKSSG